MSSKSPIKESVDMSEPSDLSNASVAQTIPQTQRRKLNLLDIHPLELAQQLSLLEHDLCKGVLLTDMEARRAHPGQQDSITPCVYFSNHLASWVMQSILEPEDTPRRAAVMEYFISVAHNARGINNISSMTAISVALNVPYIRRLQRSWKLVSEEKCDDISSCMKTSYPLEHFHYPFTTLACMEPPGVPFIGFFLGLRNEVDAYYDDITLRGYARWQSTPYPFEVDEDIRAFIQEGLSQFVGPNGNDPDRADRFTKLSLEREPEKSEEQGALRKIFNAPSRWFQRLQ